MIENRRIRFSSIDGLSRADLPIAAEVWIEELGQQPWATRSMIKLATLFKRHISQPDPEKLSLSEIDRTCQMERQQVVDALRLLYIYGAIEGYSCEDDQLRVSLHLSLLQILRVLEIRKRLTELTPREQPERLGNPSPPEEKWIPAPQPDELFEPRDDPVEFPKILPLA